MKVWIKDLQVEMEVKTNGVEFEVKDNDEKHRGDVYVTKTGITWCSGRTARENGKRIPWDEFIRLMDAR